jgi:hypothetical protein
MTKVGMVSRVLSFGVFALVFSQVPACELTVDTAPLSNKVCPIQGQKGCLNQTTNKMECVPADPAHGCAGDNCGDCRGQLISGNETLSHVATAACAGTLGACSVNICEANWGDCDKVNDNGCESDLSNGTKMGDSYVANCRLCGVNCPGLPRDQAHGITICSLGACKYTCDSGWQDCDGVFGGPAATNGCECDLSTHHCVITPQKACVLN